MLRAGRDRNPTTKKKKPATLIVSRHRLPTSSVDSTSAQVPTMDRLNPDTNRCTSYAVSTPATDMDTREVRSIFRCPRSESASVVRRNPPARPPAKKDDDAGIDTSVARADPMMPGRGGLPGRGAPVCRGGTAAPEAPPLQEKARKDKIE